MKMFGEGLVDVEGRVGFDGYYNHLDLQRTASNVDGTLTYVLQNFIIHIDYQNCIVRDVVKVIQMILVF